jgi:hypothetical protein
MGKMWACYAVKLKLEVVQQAQEHGNIIAGRKFVVDEANVSWWSGVKEKLKGIFENKCAFLSTICMYPHVEAEVYQFVMNMWKNRFTVLIYMLQFRRLDVSKETPYIH